MLIFIYAAGYMKGDYGYWRFFAYLSIFVFFMCMLVMGNNFIVLYLGWEGVGLASYLLIGYYYPRPSAVAAAKKAFITNRIGDFGLAIGIFLIYNYFGTVEYSEIFNQLATRHDLANLMPVLQYIPFCIMLGAFGKSGTVPAACLAAGCNGRPHPGVRSDPRSHDGDGGHLPDCPDHAAVFDGSQQPSGRWTSSRAWAALPRFSPASIALCTYDLAASGPIQRCRSWGICFWPWAFARRKIMSPRGRRCSMCSPMRSLRRCCSCLPGR